MFMFLFVIVLGVCFGSFINAFVWRFHEKRDWVRERSECVHCHHILSADDLIPVFSWLLLGGKCRYCKRPISKQYPIVELFTAVLFALSYHYWPYELTVSGVISLGVWLALLLGLIILLVYDYKWMLLPNKILFPLIYLAAAHFLLQVAFFDHTINDLLLIVGAVAISSGLFYVLFQISGGRWIGGGDVKLGILIGLLVEKPGYALLVLFLSSLLGSLVAIPLLVSKKLKASHKLPFGPFLIAATIIVKLFGASLVLWYQKTLLMPF